jgi:hypothetical protein
MTERMAEQDDPFLAGGDALRKPPSPRFFILPGEWQRPAEPHRARRGKRKSPSGRESANEQD